MSRRSLALAITFSLAAIPTALSASGTEKFRNEKVVVSESTLAPGELVPAAKLPSLVIYMSDGAVQMVPAAGVASKEGAARKEKVKQGETAFLPEQTGSITNTGPQPLHLVRISFLTAGGSDTWGKTGLAPTYTVLVENKYARAYEIKFPAHESEPLHSHKARVIVALSGAEIEHILPDGTHQHASLQTGDIGWRAAATHIGQNQGNTELWEIAVEPK